MADCISSGYSVMTEDDTVLKFDEKGTEMALALIKSTHRDSNWKVAVSGTVTGDTIAVSSISLE